MAPLLRGADGPKYTLTDDNQIREFFISQGHRLAGVGGPVCGVDGIDGQTIIFVVVRRDVIFLGIRDLLRGPVVYDLMTLTPIFHPDQVIAG